MKTKAGHVLSRKKGRVDPFDVVHGRKKRQTVAVSTSQLALSVPVVDQTKDDSSEEVEDINAMLKDPSQLDVSPVKSQNAQTPAMGEDSSDATKVPTSQIPKSDGSQQGRRTLATGDQLSEVQKHSVSEDKSSSLQDTPDITSLKPAKLPKSLPPEFANVPLLNLNGPISSDHESDGDHMAGTPSSTPKKKRRRRKKKKHPANLDSANDYSPSKTRTMPIQ